MLLNSKRSMQVILTDSISTAYGMTICTLACKGIHAIVSSMNRKAWVSLRFSLAVAILPELSGHIGSIFIEKSSSVITLQTSHVVCIVPKIQIQHNLFKCLNTNMNTWLSNTLTYWNGTIQSILQTGIRFVESGKDFMKAWENDICSAPLRIHKNNWR